MLMECEEADVLEMIYNISYFSEEKNDKPDDVWFIHVPSDEGEKKSSSQLPGSHSQKWPHTFLCWDQKPGCFEKCSWLITTPLAVGWERVIMPASLLFHHCWFTALQHQVTNVLIITFLIPNSSGCSPSLLALAFSHSQQLSPGQR